jgi:hypothetical protein
MFYVLNFADHTFKSCDDYSDVLEHVASLEKAGIDTCHEIEVINGFPDDIRFDFASFVRFGFGLSDSR